MDRPSPHKREEQRLINRRQQGDLGEASAIEWLTRQGATVWTPLGHSPDADLIADNQGNLLRIQVKTTTYSNQTLDGDRRWHASLATNGGNQSWSRVAKTLDESRLDYLFVLVGDGRRWFIPAMAIEGRHTIHLGGIKYSEFEIAPAGPIDQLVYGGPEALLELDSPLGECLSGQKDQTVNLTAYAYAGSNPASPILPEDSGADNGDATEFEHALGRASQVIMRPNRQMSMPKRAYVDAGLNVGDRMRVRAEAEGRVVFERIPDPPQIEELPLDPS